MSGNSNWRGRSVQKLDRPENIDLGLGIAMLTCTYAKNP